MKTRLIASLLLLLGVLFGGTSLAEVLDLVPVQGILTDSEGTPVDGLVDVTFTLYSSETGDTSLWTETYSDLDVVDGFFSVYLGTNTFLDFYSMTSNTEIWLGVTVETDEEMNRIMLASVPFAVEAMTSNQVGSLTEDDINNNFVSASAPAAAVTSNQITQWDTAYGWGNHASAGYLTSASLTETDPVFSAAAASGITSSNITNWNAAYSWGDHALAGYLTSEVDGSTTNEIELPSQSGNSGKYLTTDGSSAIWATISSGASSLSGLSDVNTSTATSGNILIADGTDFESVAIGGDFSLAGNGTATIADNSVDGTDIALGSDATGDIMYYDGSDWIRLAKGTDGQVLTISGDVPTWESASGGSSGGVNSDESGLKMIRGNVDSYGTILQGSGYSVSYNGTGNYTITFASAFSGIPSVVANVFSTSASHHCQITALSTSACTIEVDDAYYADSENQPFSFIAIGPE